MGFSPSWPCSAARTLALISVNCRSTALTSSEWKRVHMTYVPRMDDTIPRPRVVPLQRIEPGRLTLGVQFPAVAPSDTKPSGAAVMYVLKEISTKSRQQRGRSTQGTARSDERTVSVRS